MKILLLFIIFTTLTVSLIKAQGSGSLIYDNAKRNYIAGNYDEAIKYYNEYLRSSTNDDRAFYERGMCFESQRRFDEALRDYSTAISLKSSYSKYYESRGYVYLKLNLPQNALDDFNRSIQNDAFNSEGYWGRANSYIDLAKYDMALKDMNSALNIDPTNAMYLYIRAVLYTTIGDTANFFRDLELLSNLYASSFFANYKSQYVVIILDNINTNIANLSRQIVESPQENFLYFRRGFNYYLQRNFSHAENDFNSTLKYTPDPNSRMAILSRKYIENCKVFSQDK